MSNAIKILPHYTYEDYVQWEGKWELIDGIPYAMSPAPTPEHQLIANTLGALFFIELKNCKHCKAYQAIDLKIAEDTILHPDLSILCQPTSKKFIDFPPALVAEILSPSTALKDRFTKAGLYKSLGVSYYIIISPEAATTETYLLEKEEYIMKESGKDFIFQFSFEGNCTVSIDFSELWK